MKPFLKILHQAYHEFQVNHDFEKLWLN